MARFTSLLLMLLACGAFAQTFPATQPTTRPAPAAVKTDPSGPFEVQEWVVLVCDPTLQQANDDGLFQETFPEFVASRRPAAAPEAAGLPCPVGVIRIVGRTDAGADKIDVQLQAANGKFLATWPRAQYRSKGLLWKNYSLAATQPALESAGPTHWFNALRGGDAAWLVKEGKGERFLLYDVQPFYVPPLKVKAAASAYELHNSSQGPLLDVQLYKKKEDGWHVGQVPSLAGVGAASSPATSQPTTAPAAPTDRTVALAASGVKDDVQVLAAWKARLADLGLMPADQDLIVSILARHAMDARRLSVVYRMDPADVDRILPLEVVPAPRKVTRVALVIVRNIDPAIVDEVNQLITQLGDPSWKVREAAQQQLAQLGLAAKPKLEAAAKSKDVEVVFRAERLLQALSKEPPPSE